MNRITKKSITHRKQSHAEREDFDINRNIERAQIEIVSKRSGRKNNRIAAFLQLTLTKPVRFCYNPPCGEMEFLIRFTEGVPRVPS